MGAEKRPRNSTFLIEETDGRRLKLRDPLTGRTREAELCVHLDNLTGLLTVGVIRHYGDPESEPWYKDSEPWTAIEMAEYDERP